MKYRKYIIMPMLLALLSVATSCEQEELPPAVPGSDVVEVTATIGDAPDTRVSQPEDNVYTFEPNDKIHIVGWYGAWDDYNRPWEMASDAWWNDAVSTYNGYKWKTEPYMRWQNSENLDHHFLAWWPENFIKSNEDLTSVDVTVTGDYKKDDILLAHWTDKRPDDNTLHLQFNHLMARFDLNLVFNEEDYPNSASGISAQIEVVETATINLLTSSPVFTLGSTKTDISMTSKTTPAEGMVWSGYTLVIPGQDINACKVTLSFTSDNEQKSLTYTHKESHTFQSGKRTILNLTVNKNEVKGLVGFAPDSDDSEFGDPSPTYFGW